MDIVAKRISDDLWVLNVMEVREGKERKGKERRKEGMREEEKNFDKALHTRSSICKIYRIRMKNE
jgi:hypothetical protein